MFCRKISYVVSYTRDEEGSQKVTNDEEGVGGWVTISPTNDDVIYEQPLMRHFVCNYVKLRQLSRILKYAIFCCKKMDSALGAKKMHALPSRLLSDLGVCQSKDRYGSACTIVRTEP